MGFLIVTSAGAISPSLHCKMLEKSGEKFNMFSPSHCFFFLSSSLWKSLFHSPWAYWELMVCGAIYICVSIVGVYAHTHMSLQS